MQSNVIRHTIEDRNHNYWFGTWDGGLIKKDHNTGRFIQYLPESPPPYNISGRNVWYPMVDHKGIIWLSIYNVGIDLLDPDKGIVRKIRLNSNIKVRNFHARVLYMYEDSRKNIWLCTYAGLNLIDTITNIPKPVHVFPRDIAVSVIFEDTEGFYWAGSHAGGVVRFALDSTIMKRYTSTEGLSHNRICSILEDDSNNVWVSTDNGISRINYRTEKIRTYSKSDGLQGNEFLYQSSLKTKSGEMYFGGTNGLNSFFPDSIKNNKYIPKVYINKFLIFNKPVTVGVPGSPLQNAIEQTKEIVLSYKQSVFSLGFIAINYTHPEKNQYAYKMEGFDEDWIFTDANRRLATYTNLNPGTYTFRVKASNNDGVWNEQGAALNITITPPWWRTWWFKTFIVLFILSISLGYYRYRINILERQQVYLKGLVKQRTLEIDKKNSQLILQANELQESKSSLQELNATKDKFFSIIAHDLRGPFSVLLGLTEVMSNKSNNLSMEEVLQFSREMNKSASSIYRLVENLLQWAKMQQGSIPINLKYLQLHEIVNESVEVLKEAAKNKEIEIVYDIPSDLKVYADSDMLQTIIRNLVSNALKFTPRLGQITILVKNIIDKGVEIIVKDTGIGMNSKMVNNLFRLDVDVNRNGTEDEPSSGLGLILCKEFATKLKGKIWVESEEGKGTSIYLLLPDIKNDNK